MELGSVLSLDCLVGSSSESVFSSLENDPMNRKPFFDSSTSSSFLKHGRSNELEAQQEDYLLAKSLKVARTSFHGEQMLSFSAPEPTYYPHHYNPSCSLYNGGNVSMQGVMNGVRGPFSPSQWLELEHQAKIYKYIDAKAPIPSNLLLPYRRCINPTAFSFYPSGSFRSNALGWGTFHLGFSGNGDPEPGRCRRTDGKKWRCSRDAVANQKYCERHMNRGRHRSRKHVEGHSGQASKSVSPVVANLSTIASPVGSSVIASGCSQSKTMDHPPSTQIKRMQMSKENTNNHIQDSQGLSLLTTASPKNLNPFETDFGLVSPSSLLNTSRTFDSKSESQPLHRLIDKWPKTQLSISIPTDFSSSSSSPNQEKLALSPLRLSREFSTINEENDQTEARWVPISWNPPTIGGPLGEVLNNTNCSSSSLNILADELASPTGVLQKATFGSISSSTGSSPRADNNKTHYSNSNFCDDLLGLK